MNARAKALSTLEKINLKLEEARMLHCCYPKLSRNLWYYEQLEKLLDLALECEKILENCKK